MTAARDFGVNPDQHKLAVIGDRQDGKTYLAELFAVTEAFKGEKVLYDCTSMEMAAFVMQDCCELAEIFHFPVQRVRRTSGKLMVEFFSGGCIWFEPVRRGAGRGYNPTIHVIDDVHPSEGHWRAKRVLKAILR